MRVCAACMINLSVRARRLVQRSDYIASLRSCERERGRGDRQMNFVFLLDIRLYVLIFMGN